MPDSHGILGSSRDARALLLREVARTGGLAIRPSIEVAVRVLGFAPCPVCDYVWDRCRCPKEPSDAR